MQPRSEQGTVVSDNEYGVGISSLVLRHVCALTQGHEHGRRS